MCYVNASHFVGPRRLDVAARSGKRAGEDNSRVAWKRTSEAKEISRDE